MSEEAFAKALAAFQAELPQVGKGQTAHVRSEKGNYSYSYADLSDITAVAVPLLSKNGLAWTATPTLIDDGHFVLRYALVHAEGHREGGDYPLPDPTKTRPQEIGSAITYARRYAFTALTGIAPSGDDDDAQKAQDAPLPRQGRSKGRTTRTQGDAIDPDASDEWTTEVPRVTDEEWLEAARARLVLCTTPGEVRGLWVEAAQVFADNRLAPEDSATFQAEMTARTAELKGKVPA